MWCDNPILTFEKPDGEQIRVEGFCLDWGDHHEATIDNYLNFSKWLSNEDIDWKSLENDYWYLDNIVDLYCEENEND